MEGRGIGIYIIVDLCGYGRATNSKVVECQRSVGPSQIGYALVKVGIPRVKETV